MACGVGKLTIIDKAVVKSSNLSCQPIFGKEDIGRDKVDAVKRFAESTFAGVQINGIKRALSSQEDINEIFKDIGTSDLIILSADEPLWRLAIWTQIACINARVPLLRGTSNGAGLFYDPHVDCACVGCELIAAQNRFEKSADDILSGQLFPKATRGTLASAPAIVASIIAQDAIHHLTGAAVPSTLSRRILIDSSNDWKRTITSYERHSDCDICHPKRS